MLDPVSALNSASYDGAVRIEETGLRGMITLRADLADPTVGRAVQAATGLALPGMRATHLNADGGLAWMAPDELLIMTTYANADALIDTLRSGLGDTFALTANVSDARAVFRISGPGAREVLAKGAPVDLSPDAFRPGQIRRTRLGQVAAAMWMADDDSFEIVCFRSVAGFVFDWLKTAAHPGSLPNHM